MMAEDKNELAKGVLNDDISNLEELRDKLELSLIKLETEVLKETLKHIDRFDRYLRIFALVVIGFLIFMCVMFVQSLY